MVQPDRITHPLKWMNPSFLAHNSACWDTPHWPRSNHQTRATSSFGNDPCGESPGYSQIPPRWFCRHLFGCDEGWLMIDASFAWICCDLDSLRRPNNFMGGSCCVCVFIMKKHLGRSIFQLLQHQNASKMKLGFSHTNWFIAFIRILKMAYNPYITG